MSNQRIIGENDINVYKTQSDEWRAYVKGEANLQAWGVTKVTAILTLGRVIDRNTNYGFDFSFTDNIND